MGIKVFPTESLPKLVGPHLQTSLSQASFLLPLMATSVIYKGLLRYKHLGILEKLLRDITGLCTVRAFQGGILRADLASEGFWGGCLLTSQATVVLLGHHLENIILSQGLAHCELQVLGGQEVNPEVLKIQVPEHWGQSSPHVWGGDAMFSQLCMRDG